MKSGFSSNRLSAVCRKDNLRSGPGRDFLVESGSQFQKVCACVMASVQIQVSSIIN